MNPSTTHAVPAVEVRNLSVAYQAKPVLTAVSIDVPQASAMAIVGPNGAGKSTLLKSMLGLVPPLMGNVRFYGQQLGKVRQRIAYVPQSSSVDWDFPATVDDVVTMGTFAKSRIFRKISAEQREATHTALLATDIVDLRNRQIGQLSGGQRQRVFLARALAQQADMYFLDEPFQGIDAASQQAIVKVLHDLRESGKTIVMVHHDLATVQEYCDHVTLINNHVVASGPVKEAFSKDAIRQAYNASNDDFLAYLV